MAWVPGGGGHSLGDPEWEKRDLYTWVLMWVTPTLKINSQTAPDSCQSEAFGCVREMHGLSFSVYSYVQVCIPETCGRTDVTHTCLMAT